MTKDLKKIFSKAKIKWSISENISEGIKISNLSDLKDYLDHIQIVQCLIKPFYTNDNYPLVEARELLPSFDADSFEYKNIPGFSLVAFNRPLSSFHENFQYDILHPVLDLSFSQGACCPLEQSTTNNNIQNILLRLPRHLQEAFRTQFQKLDISSLDNYFELLPYLISLDRAHVLATDKYGRFHLAGTFASFPSDIDGEIKRFGVRIGKFRYGDNEMYERNRHFVYQFLMELYGFPVASERRTSSAIFARKLHKLSERFLIRVLGQSDRTITTIWNDGDNLRYPHVEKVALVRIEEDQDDIIEAINEENAFLDKNQRVVIVRVYYKQHRFDATNIRPDRALSLADQEIIHPITGKIIKGINVVRDTNNLIIRLNDIVRGEFTGRIIYKRTEIIENSDTDEKRLKLAYAWLSKHQRRLIGYSDEFYAKFNKVMESYILDTKHGEVFEQYKDIYQELLQRYNYIKQARKVRLLEDIKARNYKGENLSYLKMFQEATELLQELKFEIVSYFDDLVISIIKIIDDILQERYINKKYIEATSDTLTKHGLEIKKYYSKLVLLRDDFDGIRKSRQEREKERNTPNVKKSSAPPIAVNIEASKKLEYIK